MYNPKKILVGPYSEAEAEKISSVFEQSVIKPLIDSCDKWRDYYKLKH